jgi:hypothetical protein
MSLSYTERVAQSRRLVILTILGDMPGRRANLSTIYNVLDELAEPATIADLRADSEWLTSQRLVERDEVLEVASGKRRHPGVAPPPAPGSPR